MDEKSQQFLTISTHVGLFRYLRLPFGVASAPAKFQKIMDSLFSKVKQVGVFQDEIKRALKSADVLAHFNPRLEVRLTVDASSIGIGAVLSRKYPSGVEKPIAFASHTLSVAEKKYSQIGEKV